MLFSPEKFIDILLEICVTMDMGHNVNISLFLSIFCLFILKQVVKYIDTSSAKDRSHMQSMSHAILVLHVQVFLHAYNELR
jgi:hypothetical protein